MGGRTEDLCRSDLQGLATELILHVHLLIDRRARGDDLVALQVVSLHVGQLEEFTPLELGEALREKRRAEQVGPLDRHILSAAWYFIHQKILEPPKLVEEPQRQVERRAGGLVALEVRHLEGALPSQGLLSLVDSPGAHRDQRR